MSKYIKLKDKPIEPIRLLLNKFLYIEDGCLSVADFNKEIEKLRLDPDLKDEDIKINILEDYCLEIEYFSPEPQPDFDKRYKQYEKQLNKYNEWYNKNRELIERELEYRKELEKLKKEKEIQRRQEQDKRNLAKLKKEIKKIEERLK